MQSPGAAALKDPSQYPRLEAYVKGIVGAFANDPRVLGWDVWNEPDNTNSDAYGKSNRRTKSISFSRFCRKCRVGSRGRRHAAAYQRCVGRRLVFSRNAESHGKNPNQ